MDEIENIFSSGSGQSLVLARRNEILEQSQVLLSRVRIRKSEKSILISAPFGAGKTSLLNEIEQMARREGCKTIFIDANGEKQLSELLVPALKSALIEFDCLASTEIKEKRGLRVFKSFVGSLALKDVIDIDPDIEPESGVADSGDIEIDLPVLLEAVAEVARERQAVIALLIDEIQCLKSVELSALIMALHRLQQRQLPFALVAAGLPILSELIVNSKGYTERLFSFHSI